MKSKQSEIKTILKIILLPIWGPLFIVLYLSWIIFSAILLIILPIVCVCICSLLLMLPWLLVPSFSEFSWWFYVLIIISGVVGMICGMNLCGYIIETDFFKMICYFKEENIDESIIYFDK